MHRLKYRLFRLGWVCKRGVFITIGAATFYILLQNVFLSTLNNTSFEEKSDESFELWKKPTLLNVTNFRWLLGNTSMCTLFSNSTTDRLFIVLILSARSNFFQRSVIRKSYGLLQRYKQWHIRTIFLLGEASSSERKHSKDLKTEHKLYEEYAKYGDFVMGSFVDSYSNLTYKHLMGYKWVLNYCQNASLVLKTDDDWFLDLMTYLDWRNADLVKNLQDTAFRLPDIYCYSIRGGMPIREKEGPKAKWYTSWDDWPETYFPDYCSGQAVALNVPLIQKLYSVSNDVKYNLIEDMFMTGLLMKAVKVKYNWAPEIRNIPRDKLILEYRPNKLCNNGLWNRTRDFPEIYYTGQILNFNKTLFERDMICLWNKTVHDYKSKTTTTTG